MFAEALVVAFGARALSSHKWGCACPLCSTAFCAPQYCTLPSNMPEFLDDLHRIIVVSTFVAAFMLNFLRRIAPPFARLPRHALLQFATRLTGAYCSFCTARRMAAFASSFGNSAEKLPSCFGRSASGSACRKRCVTVAVVRFPRTCTTHLFSQSCANT